MFGFFLAILIVKLVYDGIRKIYSEAVAEQYYKCYRNYREMVERETNGGR